MTILLIKTFQRTPILPRNSSLFKLNTAHSRTVILFPKGNLLLICSFAETKGGVSEGPVRRIEIFLDSHSGSDPQAKALSIIKKGTTEGAGGWRTSSWFGQFWSMEMDGFTTEFTVIFICLQTGKTAFGLTVRNAGGFGRLRTCIHTSIRQIKVLGCTCWESPTEKASFSITEPIGSSFNKDPSREVAAKQPTCKCRLAIFNVAQRIDSALKFTFTQLSTIVWPTLIKRSLIFAPLVCLIAIVPLSTYMETLLLPSRIFMDSSSIFFHEETGRRFLKVSYQDAVSEKQKGRIPHDESRFSQDQGSQDRDGCQEYRQC